MTRTVSELVGSLRLSQPGVSKHLISLRSTVELEPEFLTKVPAGWHFHLDALGEHLEGGSTDLVELPGWKPIHEAYEAKLA